MKIMESYLKWVRVARYELILSLDGALWLTIISDTPLTPRKVVCCSSDYHRSESYDYK